MTTVRTYDHICKNCWHQWRSPKKATQCPKCKGKDLDVDYDLDFE